MITDHIDAVARLRHAQDRHAHHVARAEVLLEQAASPMPAPERQAVIARAEAHIHLASVFQTRIDRLEEGRSWPSS